MGRPSLRLAALSALALLMAPAPGAALELRGEVEAELRGFDYDDGHEWTPSAAGRLEVFHRFWDPALRFNGEFFYRVDGDDGRRTRGDVREAYIQALGEQLEVVIGYRRVFWGVAESRSLVDVINQTDLVEDISGDDKLGQPMIHLSWLGGPGTTQLFLLPGTRKRTFPGPDGYPRLPFAIDEDASRFEGRRGRQRLDLGARWSMSGRGFDIGLGFFDGIARDPDFLPCLARGSGLPGTTDGPNCDLAAAVPDAPNLPPLLIDLLRRLQLIPGEADIEAEVMQRVLDNLALVPAYPRSRQFSVDAQIITGNLILRVEGLSRERSGRHSLAAVAGLEYTLPRFFDTGWDVGLLAEYLYDQRRDDPLTRRFDDDLFLGLRLFLNDLPGTTVLAGAIVERDFGNRLFSVEASRRIGADWRATLDLRVFSDPPEDLLGSFLEGQDMLRLRLVRYF